MYPYAAQVSDYSHNYIMRVHCHLFKRHPIHTSSLREIYLSVQATNQISLGIPCDKNNFPNKSKSHEVSFRVDWYFCSQFTYNT